MSLETLTREKKDYVLNEVERNRRIHFIENLFKEKLEYDQNGGRYFAEHFGYLAFISLDRYLKILESRIDQYENHSLHKLKWQLARNRDVLFEDIKVSNLVIKSMDALIYIDPKKYHELIDKLMDSETKNEYTSKIVSGVNSTLELFAKLHPEKFIYLFKNTFIKHHTK